MGFEQWLKGELGLGLGLELGFGKRLIVVDRYGGESNAIPS